MEARDRVSDTSYQHNGTEHSHDSLPAVAADVVESAVMLAKAEVKLVLAETKEVALKALAGIAWVIICGFLLQTATALLVLGPLLTMDLSAPTRWLLLLIPVVLAAASGVFAYVSIKKAINYGRQ